MTKVNKPGRSPKFGKSKPPSLGVRVRTLLTQLKAPFVTPAGAIEYDSVTASAMPRDGYAYQGYYNGSFANMSAVKADHPGKVYESVTPNGDPGADELDIEPGDASVLDAPAFYRAKGGKNVKYYTNAGNSQALINHMAANGIRRDHWKLRSAHWTGRHTCAPYTCGYPVAEATQFASNNWYDTSLVTSPYFVTSPPPGPVFPLKQGSSGLEVLQLQKALNVWAPDIALHPALKADGSFGPATKGAVVLAQIFWEYAGGAQNGEVDQSLWNHLHGLVPPPNWAYTAPLALKVSPGWFRVWLSWQPPAPKADIPFPVEYLVYIYQGKTPTSSNIVTGYPKVVTGLKAIESGLKRKTMYTVHVVAAGRNRTHAGLNSFASATFSTK